MIRPSTWRRELTPAIHSLQSEFNRLFEEFWNQNTTIGSATIGPTDLEAAAWVPAVDLHETPTELVFQVDLPGVDPATIDLSLTGPVLTLRGERVVTAPPAGVSKLSERNSGAFLRQITLTDEVDFENVQAEARNGVLTVRLPKRQAAKPRTIPISS